MSHVRVEIDLNSLRADGTTRARLSRATGPMKRGDIVTAFESEDGVAAYAWVDRVDEARGVVFLTINRASMREDDGRLGTSYTIKGTNRASAKVANERANRAAASATRHSYALRASH